MKKVKGLSNKQEKKTTLIDTDNSMVITRENGWGEREEGRGEMNGDGRDLALGGEHTIYR